MNQSTFVKFLENMITLCQSTLAEMRKEEINKTPVAKRNHTKALEELPVLNGVQTWVAWASADEYRRDSIIHRVYESGESGKNVYLTQFGSNVHKPMMGYRVSSGDRATYDLDRFRSDYESGWIRVITVNKSLPLERPLGKQASLMDMVVDDNCGCSPVPESASNDMRFQALSEQLLAAVLRRDKVCAGDYRKLADETGANMAEIKQTLDRLASEPLNLLNRRATAVGTVYTPAE